MPQKNNSRSWYLKSSFLQKVKKKGGFVNSHAHFDKSHIISYKNLKYAEETLQQKWKINNKIKKNYTWDDLTYRISLCFEKMISQGVKYCLTFVDIDSFVKLLPLQAVLHVRDKYKSKIKVLVANQTLRGVLKKEEQNYIEEAAEMVDILGGLPEYEHPYEAEHLDYIFKLAKKYNKRIHIHVDQQNSPRQKETELLAKKTIEHGWEGKVTGIHAISLNSQSEKEKKRVIKLIKDAGMSIIVCPTAAINMLQLHNETAPIHNSIAPVPQLVEAGVNVALGTDNICDIYGPFCEGNMYREAQLLMDAVRWWQIDKVVDIVSVNGLKALGIKWLNLNTQQKNTLEKKYSQKV